MSDQASRRIGDYEILNELGSGGMGRVYKVRNVISERVEAMKILLPDLAGRQELAARFLREIKVLASLNHPNIAQLRTALTIENQLVMIMEYVEGTSLAARLEHGPIVISDALNYISQVLDALAYAHQQHVIHRDIKPANMMLTPQGVVKLMDFGIARSEDNSSLTMSGTTLGSLSYMSPEQVKGQATDARSDLYSVGISLYEMVTGQRPFQADSDYAIMAAHVKEAPRPPIELQPGLPQALNEIILMAIAKDPAQRFQSADAFRNALGTVQPVATPARSTSSSRQATVVDSGLSAAIFHEAPTVTRPPVAASASQVSDHARTVIDTRPPSSPAIQPMGTKTPSRPMVPPPPPPQTSHKGLYMALGALIVVGALAAVGIYSRKAEAGPDVSHTKPTPPAPVKVEHAVQHDVTPPPPPPKPEPGITKAVAVARVGAGKKEQTDVAPPEPPQKATDMDALEHEIDQLSARAGAINSSLDRMQAEQAKAGYGLRGDMAARQSSMKLNLQKAQDAIEHGDGARAKRYKDLTEADVDALEKFLGR